MRGVGSNVEVASGLLRQALDPQTPEHRADFLVKAANAAATIALAHEQHTANLLAASQADPFLPGERAETYRRVNNRLGIQGEVSSTNGRKARP